MKYDRAEAVRYMGAKKDDNEWEVIVEPDHLLQLSEALEENMEEPQL